MKDISSADKVIVCTDLDGTLIGDDDSMYELLEIVDNEGILVAFSTGRHLPAVTEFIEEKGVPEPDACTCLVGTEIYFPVEGELVLDERWSQIISEGWHRQEIEQLLDDIKELQLQEEEWQTRFKLSYYLKDNQPEVVKEVTERLESAKLKANVIPSAGELLDVLPVNSGKAKATQYVADELAIGSEAVIVCGDSGNDLGMFKAGFKGIIVGNARDELKDFEGENTYHAKSEYSAGIIEGLEHFDII